ncbi:hypothetical protein CARUB_v10027792mg [Capsella rubella]|uniref:Knottin scorpion toxin-like domain-containing protein n=1 Tax=Capsella rubella TaxID=81985 RepID=R0GD08_9BRAS|nr:putative defensin-like protein 224 [Capsella rubella]EOA14554.1 hypothetical protein CARUB_v10027792mg [Capsella rubella]
MKTCFLFVTLLILISSCASNIMARHVTERKTPISNNGDRSPQNPPNYMRFGNYRGGFIPEQCTQICAEHCFRKHRFPVYCRLSPEPICLCSSFLIPPYIQPSSPKQSIK